MKKVLTLVFIVALTAAMAVGLAACNRGDGSSDAVTVKYYADGAAVQAAFAAGAVDYAVVAEPAATAFSAKFGYHVVMDLQEEYIAATGRQSGYPMASTFVKGELASDADFVSGLLDRLNDNIAYISEHASEMTALLAEAGSTSAFPPASVTRCNIGVYDVAAAKDDVNYMLKDMLGKDMPDTLYYDENAAETDKDGGGRTLQLYVPDGAPALAVAVMIAEETYINGYKINVNIVQANEIASKMAQGSGDIVVMPTNAGANLIVNKGADYKFVCTNTKGMLYVLGKNEETLRPADLKGKTVGCIGQGAVPQYAFEKVLTSAGLSVE